MNYNLLTIGNITKICDDNLYLNNKGDISILQWFTFQLYFLLEKLGISNIDPVTNLKITKAQIYNILYEKYNGKIDIDKYIDADKQLWKDYGFIKIDINNSFDNKNIGGDILFTTQINKQKTDIIFPTKRPFFGDIQSKTDKRQRDKLRLKKAIKQSTAVPVSSAVPVSTDTGKEKCTKLGKFSWSRNSCYADSILLLMIYRIIFNKDSTLYTLISSFKYTDELIAQRQICRDKDIIESKNVLNNMLDTFRDLISRVEQGQIFDIQYFLKLIQNCPNRFSENYYDGLTHDTTEFLYNILNLFNIQTENGNILNQYYFSNINNNITESNVNSTMFYLAPMQLTNALGENFYDNKTSSIKRSHIQFLKISKESLLNLYKSIIPTYDPADILLNPSDYIFDKLLDRQIKKSDLETINHRKQELKYRLQDILGIKELNYLGDEVAFHLKEGYQIIHTDDETQTAYYTKEGDTSPNAVKSSDLLPADIGFRLKYKIDEHLLDNNTEDIIIKLDRKYLNRSLREEHNDITIIPDEYMTINSSNYELYGIVIWYQGHYVSYYRCGNEYYLYDDNSTKYIYYVGDYNALLIHNYGIRGIVNTHSRILYYIRK